MVELVVSSRVDVRQLDGGSSSSPVESMWESLVLGRRRVRWVGSGQICPLEIGSSEVSDAAADRGGKLGDGFLDLGGIIITFGLIDAGDPAAMSDQSDQTRF